MFAFELIPAVVAGPGGRGAPGPCDPWRLMTVVAGLQALRLLPLPAEQSAEQLRLVHHLVSAARVPEGELVAVNQ